MWYVNLTDQTSVGYVLSMSSTLVRVGTLPRFMDTTENIWWMQRESTLQGGYQGMILWLRKMGKEGLKRRGAWGARIECALLLRWDAGGTIFHDKAEEYWRHNEMHIIHYSKLSSLNKVIWKTARAQLKYSTYSYSSCWSPPPPPQPDDAGSIPGGIHHQIQVLRHESNCIYFLLELSKIINCIWFISVIQWSDTT